MKIFSFSLLMLSVLLTKAQITDSVNIPNGVVYHYCSPEKIETAKKLLKTELSDSINYSLGGGATFVGPQLWSRYSKIPTLSNIPNGNITIRFNNKAYPGKLLQDKDGFKKVWDQLVSEIKNESYTIRKATNKELVYYWAVISFDIDEPLLILQTSSHRFLFNFMPADLKLVWIDEIPSSMK